MLELNFPNPVQNEKDFYGRKLELQRIERTFRAGSGRPVIILGERRVGKTSLQTVSAKRLSTGEGDHFVPLFLPPAKNIRSLNDYAEEILQRLCSFLGKSLQETDVFDADKRFQLASIGQFGDVAAWLLEEAVGKTFIVCIDELDTILLESARAEADQILGLTDYVAEKADLPLTLYFTMTCLPESVTASFGSPTSISEAEIIELGPFSPDEMQQMVKGILGDQVVLDDGAMERLFGSSGGHPYVAKLLLDRLLARYWSEGSALSVTSDMIEYVITDATDDPRARVALANIYDVHFNPQEQQLVLLLADRLDEGRTQITAEEMQILGSSFQKAARVMERRGYLTRDAQNRYAFRIEFLGRWLRDWEEYEEESEHLEDIRQRLKRLADPWHNVEETVVTDEDKRRFGLRP